MRALAPALVGVVLFAASSVEAEPYYHDRFYFRGGLGLGAGWLGGKWDIEGRPSGMESKNSSVHAKALMREFELLFGGTRRSGLVIGGGIFVRSAYRPSGHMMGYDFDDVSEFRFRTYEAVFFSDYYPNPASGFHVLGSAGLAAVLVSSPYFRYSLSNVGPSLGAGTGYDFWLGPQTSIGPLLSLHYIMVPGAEPLERMGSVINGSLTIALTVH
jgi:hypothetical protein